MAKHKPNKALQRDLRERIEAESLFAVANQFGIGREVLARYLADLPMRTSTFRGIEASIVQVRQSASVGADEGGLR